MGFTAVYDKKKTCPVCGRDFWASRHSAVYDSDACRKSAQRDRQGIKPAAKKAMDALSTIKGYYHDQDPKLDMKARRTLREIRDMLDVWLMES